MNQLLRERIEGYIFRLEKIMIQLEDGAKPGDIQIAVQALKHELNVSQHLNEGISEAYFQMPKLNTKQSAWHEKIYNAHGSLTWAIEHS